MNIPQSKYEFIKTRILEDIEKGIYENNDKIPSENELCRLYDTSRITVRKALDELTAQGILYRLQGVGSFVKRDVKDGQTADVEKILLVLPNYPELFSSGIVSDVLIGIEEVLEKTEFSFVTVMEPRNEEDNEKFIQNIIDIKPMGIIYSFYFNSDLQGELKKLNVPIVFLDSEPKDNMFDVVTGEDFESAYRATQLLLMEGYKKIGFYSQWSSSFSTCKLRCEGTKQALRDSNIKIKDEWFSVSESVPMYHEAIMRFDTVTDIKSYLKRNEELEALVAMNDSTSLAAYKAIAELGKSIPKDLKLISYGNYNWTAFYEGGLTSYEQYFSNYGKEAAKLVLQRINNEIPAIQQRRIMKYDFIRRKSF